LTSKIYFDRTKTNLPPTEIVKKVRTSIQQYIDQSDTEKFNGLEAVLCGDIHKRQEFKFKTGKGYMIGSPIQQNIGESIGRHGYGIYDVETKEYSYVDLPNPKPFLKFSIKSFEDIENGTEKLQNI
jgi:DNA repair exonuclease SbcCD nuclease subunit